MKNWVFYGENNNGSRVIHFIKRCKKPELTNERKKMMQHLENYVYQRVGYISADAWNENNELYKWKINAQYEIL
tara:strand:+ start:232 stop:453 length:222 start_codon:yes stop_codon:yes gene_type:complete